MVTATPLGRKKGNPTEPDNHNCATKMLLKGSSSADICLSSSEITTKSSDIFISLVKLAN